MAIHLTNLVSPRCESEAPPDPFAKMMSYSAAEADPLGAGADSSPEFQSILAPLVALLSKMEKTTEAAASGNRATDEILVIAHSFNEQ